MGTKGHQIVDVMFSEANLLYILVEAKNHYYIYEKNLNTAYQYILRNFVDPQDEMTERVMALKSMGLRGKFSFLQKKDQPIATILKEKIDNKIINSFHVRNSIDVDNLSAS
jgi:hypothetical protein